jgi:hypothetical protein
VFADYILQLVEFKPVLADNLFHQACFGDGFRKNGFM